MSGVAAGRGERLTDVGEIPSLLRLNRGTAAAAIFYIVAVPTSYLYFFLLFDVAESILMGLALSLSILIVFTLSSYVISTRISKVSWSIGLLGVRKKGLVRSFLLASIPSIFGPLAQLYIIRTSGIGTLAHNLLSYPGSLNQILRSLPASLFFFLVVAVLAFGFFQALPSGLLDRYRTRWVIPVVVVMWAVLYGAANVDLGVAPSLGDAGLFGFIFLLVYTRTKNSVGPILAYVLLAEEPAWVALALMNPGAYIASLYAKVSWSLIATGASAYLWASGRSKTSRSNPELADSQHAWPSGPSELCQARP